MGFFGGLIGVIVAIALFVRKHPGLKFDVLADEVVVMLPIGIALTRIVNFINDELVGQRLRSRPALVHQVPQCRGLPLSLADLRVASRHRRPADRAAGLPAQAARRRGRLDVVHLYGVTRSIAELWRQTGPRGRTADRRPVARPADDRHRGRRSSSCRSGATCARGPSPESCGIGRGLAPGRGKVYCP